MRMAQPTVVGQNQSASSTHVARQPISQQPGMSPDADISQATDLPQAAGGAEGAFADDSDGSSAPGEALYGSDVAPATALSGSVPSGTAPATGTTKSGASTRKPSSRAKASAGSSRSPSRRASGLALERRYTSSDRKPFDELVWERRSSMINNPDGSQVFRMDGAEIPAGWSQLATDIVVSKYFRKAGVGGDPKVGETSVRQVVG